MSQLERIDIAVVGIEVAQKLRQLQQRFWLRIFLRRLIVIFPGFIVLLTAVQYFPGISDGAFPFSTLITAAIVISVLLALAVTWGTDTGVLRVARHLEDANPKLHAVLSTAIEVSVRDTERTPIEMALLFQANQVLVTVGTGSIGLRPPARWMVACAVSLTIFSSTFLLNAILKQASGFAPASIDYVSESAMSDSDLVIIKSELKVLADLFSDRLEHNDDTYMQAIARQVEDLRNRLDSEPMSRSELAAALERLNHHTRTAVDVSEGGESTKSSEKLLDSMSGLVQRVQQQELREELVEEQPFAPGILTLEQTNHDSPISGSEVDGQPGEHQAAGPAESAAPTSEAQSGPSPRFGAEPDDEVWQSYHDIILNPATIAELNAMAFELAEQNARGEAIGPSTDSQEGASSFAGDGTDELFGTEAAEQLNAERIEQLSVSEETDSEGRHVRIEVNPEAEFTEVFATPLGATAWSRSTEAEVMREALMTDQRLVTARYHTPEQAE